MVCVTALPCTIKFNLYNGAKDKNLSDIEYLLNASTRGKDLYDYIQECGQIQPESFKLYLLSAGTVIDLSENKDKTMSEIGVDFSCGRGSTKCKHTLLVVDPTSTSTSFSTNSLVQEQVECNLPTYNPPPPSPNHSSVWSEDNFDCKTPIKPEICYVGLVNQAMTCYLNSLLQALYMTPEFRNALYNWEYVEGSEKDEANSIPYQLQKLFLNLQTSTKSAVETTALTKSFGWDSTEAWQQHDIQELCRVMFDALEQKFKNTEQADLINRLYEGTMIDYVKCLECNTEKSREDTFLDIPLPVRPFGSNVTYSSVEEALRAFVQYETLEGNNQYFCEKCNKKCDAHKGLKFTKFPYLLTLHLKRFDFDFKTFHRIKLNDKVTFPDILNLNSFITSAPNQESPSSDENTGLAKCDDSSTTNSGTLDDDHVLCESNLSNSNHATNHNQNGDEDIDMSNGPSTSNRTVQNHENEKNRNSSGAAKGPYNYELFSIMIHSGSASGGHYYAYIKDFKTQEWLCFNDQSVTEITHDDIQKTYGGGPSRPYHRVSSSCANAYMLMYRQIDSARNALPMQVQDFPKHIQELLKKIENEDKDREIRISQHKIHMSLRMSSFYDAFLQQNARLEKSVCKVKVHCTPPNETTLLSHRLTLRADATWAETTKHVYKNFLLEKVVDLDQCRLVAYDEYSHEIVASYEGRENETFGRIWNNGMNDLLLEIRDKDQMFESYPKGIVTKVFIVDVPTRELVEGPIIVRALLTQTVKEYKQMIGKKINMDLSEMEVIFREYGMDAVLVPDNDIDLRAAGFCNLVNVFVSSIPDTEYKSLFNTAICGIIEELENVITLRIQLPDTSKEALEELNIPPLEEESKDKEKAVSTSLFKVSVNDLNRDTGPKSNEVTKTGKSTEDTPVRNASPQLGEGEEWNTPEQSNSEDSSLSDSDKTLVGDAPEDDVFQSSCLPSKNRAIKMQNQSGFDNWENLTDDTKYFKATPYMNTYRKFLKVLVDKRMIFNNFKKRLAPYVGVRPEYFKVLRYFDESSESECSLFGRLTYEDEEKLRIELGRTLRNGEFTVTLYQLFIDSPQPYKLLGEWVFSQDMQVSQAKKELLADIKRKHDIDIPYERCRLRRKCLGTVSKVILDDDKFTAPFPRIEMTIQELPDKEPITNKEQIALFVRRWFVEKMQLEPYQEIILDEKSVKELHKKLSSISDIPEKHLKVTTANFTLSYTSMALTQDEWDWNETMRDIVSHIKNGAVFVYRDNRETVSNLTREVFSEIPILDAFHKVPSSPTTRYSGRKEKALRINLVDE